MPNLGTLTQSYTFDSLNRLTNASETGGSGWTQSYGYYGNGNMYVSANTGLPPLSSETPQGASWYSASAIPNRINGWGYDLNGNVLQIANTNRSFTYDAENRQVTATISPASSSYLYDGLGQRVSKTVGGQTTTLVYDAFGELAAEYGSPEASQCGTATCYVTQDHLGSTRLLTDSAGSSNVRRYDYLPFGGELLAGIDGRTNGLGYQTAPDDLDPKFTGKNRDPETGLDWFEVRYLSGAQGRFQSVDPGNAGAALGDPQTWNGYAYVNNNPVSSTDPSGEGFFGWLFGAIGDFFFGSVGSQIGELAGNGLDAAIWGPDSTRFSSAPNIAGVLGGCGGPLGNCGSLGAAPWSENSGLGNVQDPGRFVFEERPADEGVVDYYANNILAAAADSFSMGYTRTSRRSHGLKDADYCGGPYMTTTAALTAVSLLRVTYAGAAKGALLLQGGETTEEAGRAAVSARNVLKRWFRFGTFPKSRMGTYEGMIANPKYGGDPSEVIAAAGRTNVDLNTAGGITFFGSIGNIGRYLAGCHE